MFWILFAVVVWWYMTLWFGVSLQKKRNDVADIAWGLGFVLLGWMSWLMAPRPSVRGFVVAVLVTVWGVRLAWHIYARYRQHAEDYRYAAWRKEWGSWFTLRSYLQVFMLQGLLLYLIAVPVLSVNKIRPTSLNLFDVVGLLIWLLGFVFEVVGDAQLKQFMSDAKNKGKLLTSGLWQYTRHPNYFGEVTMWWGLAVVAMAAGANWWVFIGPLTITFLILRVSGVPLLENKMKNNPHFTAYVKHTNKFLPWFKKVGKF